MGAVHDYQDKTDKSEKLYGYWPKSGEDVLIVADSTMTIRLMAKKQGEFYRFWDPNIDLLGSWFHFTSPALPAPICLEYFPDSDHSRDCFDGCLYPIDLIEER